MRCGSYDRPTAATTEYENEQFDMRADIERAAQAVRVAAEFDWTWTVDDLQPFCDRVGWQLSGLDERFPTATTNFEVNRPDVMVSVKGPERTNLARTLK